MQVAKRTRTTPPAVRSVAKRRYQRKKNFQAVPRTLNPTGFPKMLKMTHKYVETNIQLNYTAAGSVSFYRFSANNMFDPNITGTGHQPSYFDTLAGLYDHYTVIGSRITLKINPGSFTSLIGPAVGVIYIDDNATSSLTRLHAVAEQASCGPVQVFGGSNDHNNLIFRRTWSAVKAFGPNPLANDKLVGTTGGSPTEQQYFVFAYETNDLSGATIYLNVTIEYIAIWNELKEIAQS